eukprot:13565210-Ditylum_brightwellii.AAC.1
MATMYVYPLQWINDEHIMPKVIASKKFKDKDIQHINYCHMYLNVMTISDVTLANGKELDQYMYQGKTLLHSSPATHMKMHQQKPGLDSWQAWQKAMMLWATDLDLRTPLRQWLFPALLLARHWP